MAIPEMDGGAIWSVVPVDDQVVPESVEKQTLPVAALASVIVNAFVAVPDATALNATAPPPPMSVPPSHTSPAVDRILIR